MNPTDEQQKFIDSALKQNTYCEAGPGCGKSTVLATIAEQLLNRNKLNNLMLLTFTNKSANDIINKTNCCDKTRIKGGTFHSIIYKIMIERGVNISICDESKKRLIIKRIFKCQKDKDLFEEKYKNINKAKSVYPTLICEDTNKYNEELKKYNMYDFDDIISCGIDFLKNEPNIYINTSHILVDELQDTSQAQLELLKMLQSVSNANMVGISDLDQSIYEWRNADPTNVKEFIKHFGCKVTTLGLNFRSTQKIVDASAKLIANNSGRIPKNLRAHNRHPGIVHLYKCNDEQHEISYVVSKCRILRNKNITILYRNRLNKMKLEFELRKNRIRYTVNDSTDITDRSAFRVYISMIKIASGLYDLYDLEIAAKGMKKLGTTTVKKLGDIKKNNIDKSKPQLDIFAEAITINNFNDLIKYASISDKRIKRTTNQIWKLQEDYNTLQQKKLKLSAFIEIIPEHLIKSFEVTDEIKTFMTDITEEYKLSRADILSLCNDFGLNATEEVNDDDANVELSTIHGFKGGENDVVILPFCDWKFKPDDNVKNIFESERRLFYVAVTRPKRELYMSYSGTKKPKFIKEMGL